MQHTKKSSWRESRETVPSQVPFQLNFYDTRPNHILISNNSAAQMFLSISNLVSATTFDTIIPAYGVKLYAREQGIDQVYLFTEAAVAVPVHVTSFEAEFNPAAIQQTQEIVTSGGSGLLGVVDVKNILNPLPTGQNTIGLVVLAEGLNNIGAVVVSDLPSLPAGTNIIGGVDVVSLPPLPSGINNIGDVDVASLPVIGAHGNAWNAAAVLAAGVSAAIDTLDSGNITVFGNSSAITDLTIQYSQDGINFYSAEEINIAAAGDFFLHIQTGAKFIQIVSSAAATLTVTVAGKVG